MSVDAPESQAGDRLDPTRSNDQGFVALTVWGRRLLWLALAILTAYVAITRVPAPWRYEQSTDEQHHQRSWRNRYGTDDVYPVFIRRVSTMTRLPPRVRDWVQWTYDRGPLAQRAFIVLVDPQPPVFPILMEAIEAASNSSLVAQRVPSVLCGIASVLLAWRIGRQLRGPGLALLFASLIAIWPLATAYSGIARPYAAAQTAYLVMIAAAIDYARSSPERRRLRRLLAACLLAQAFQWMTWATAGMIVVYALWHEVRAGRTVGALLRQAWWYILCSLILMAYMAVQLANPTISNQHETLSGSMLFTLAKVASPFAGLSGFGPRWMTGSAILFGVLAVIGAAVVGISDLVPRRMRAILLLAVAGDVFAFVFIGASGRFMMTYNVLPILLAAAAIAWAARTEPIRISVAILMLCGGLAVFFARPFDVYAWVLPFDSPRYSIIAKRLETLTRDGTPWATYPYIVANTLYRYASLPEPLTTDNPKELQATLDQAANGRRMYVLVPQEELDKRSLPELNTGRVVAQFGQGESGNQFTIVEIGDRPTSTSEPTTSGTTVP